MSFGGVTIITFSESNQDKDKAKHRILGDAFTLISAITYGLYATFLKYKIPEEAEKHFSMSLFFGFVGLINIFVLLPLFPILHFTGVETFELPNARTIMFLSINALLGTCASDFCWAKSVVILGPLFTQLGISLTIPLGILATSFIDKVSFTWLYYLGTLLVFISFIGVTYLQYKERKESKKLAYQKLKQHRSDAYRSSKFNIKEIEQNEL